MPSVGLPQQVTVRPYMPILTDSMSLLQKLKTGMGSPDWNVSVVVIRLRKRLWGYCPGHAGVKGNEGAGTLAGKAALTSGLRLGRSEVLRSLRHYLAGTKPRASHHRSTGGERGLESGHWSSALP